MYGTCGDHSKPLVDDLSITTPQSPESVASASNSCEDLLLNRKWGANSFWQKITSMRHNGTTKGPTNSQSPFKDNDLHQDDQEIDNRSVQYYESGSCDKAERCVRGTITFSLRYDFIHRVLMVHVIRANSLPAENLEPYVKLYLLPERRNQCKTKICKKSGDPEFNEMFSFDAPYTNLSNRMLQFTVYNFDHFTRHGLIGNVILRDLFEKSELVAWTEYTMQIVGSQGKKDFGDLLLYLNYSVCDRKLFVTVSKAYNLRPMDITGASDPYVKVEQIYQRQRVKMRKTTIKRANLNPVYYECLEFDLPLNEIQQTNLLIQVMDWDRIGHDDLLGCCIIGAGSPTAEGRQQWNDCFKDLDINSGTAENRQPVGTWHSILDEVPENWRYIQKGKK